MKLKDIAVLTAAVISPMTMAATYDGDNSEIGFTTAGTAIQIKHVHGDKGYTGSFNLADGYAQWLKDNPTSKTTGWFQLKTGDNDRQNGVDVNYVIDRDLSKAEGLNGTLKIAHDSNVLDQRLKRTISGTVSGGATLGTQADPVLFQLYTASILGTHLGGGKDIADLQNIHSLTFTGAGTTVYGDVINLHFRYPDAVTSYKNGSLNNDTTVTVSDGAVWNGDLLTQTYDREDSKDANRVEASEETDKIHANSVHNTVKLSNGAQWTGATRNVGAAAVTNLQIDNASWTVTGNSNVTNLGTQTSAVITLNEGVRLTVDKMSLGTDVTADTPATLSDASASGFTVRVNGLNGTQMSVDSGVDAIKNVVAAAGVNDGTLSVGQMQEGLMGVVTTNGTRTEGSTTRYAIEAGAFTNGYAWDATVDAEGKSTTTAVRTQVNDNARNVSDSTAITMMQWRAEATDLMERMGDLRGNAAQNGVWTRVTGGRNEYGSIDNDFVTFQFGYDHKLATESNVWVGGAFSYTDGNSDHSTGTGDNRVLAMSGYGTWLLDGGSYLDLAVRYGTLRNSFDLDKAGGTFNTQAVSAALEGGHRFELPANFFVQPAVGVSYSHIFGETYSASTTTGQGNVAIDQDGIDSIVARVGLLAGISCPGNKGNAYVRAFYNHDFDGQTSTRIDNVNAIEQDFGGDWYEVGAGANLNFTDSLRGWADFKYIAGGEIDTPWRVSIGLRYMY